MRKTLLCIGILSSSLASGRIIKNDNNEEPDKYHLEAQIDFKVKIE